MNYFEYMESHETWNNIVYIYKCVVCWSLIWCMFIGYRISSRNFIKYSELHELRTEE